MHTNAKSNWVILALLSLSGVCVLTACQGFPGQAAQKTEPSRTSATGGCPAPSSPGVVVCQPFPPVPTFSTEIPSPVQVIASATASEGRVIQMQALADGRKIAQTQGDRFDAPVTLSPGTHTLTVVARETGGSSLISAPVSLEIFGSTAGQACAPPASPGVKLCTPDVSGIGTACAVEPWFTLVASGTAQTGTVREMQLWVNDVDVANFAGNYLNTNVVPDFLSYVEVRIVEVDSKGQSVSSPSVFFEGPC